MTISMEDQAWPPLPYAIFAPTVYFLHRLSQAIGKLKLYTPFEPHWSNVALWLTARGLTTGPIPYGQGIFCIEIDVLDHRVICTTSWGEPSYFTLQAMSVAEVVKKLFSLLEKEQIHLTINMMPQEIPNPIAFNEDLTLRAYDKSLVAAWWRILVNSYKVLQQYHSRFDGETPFVGLMWGTFDLRDARYSGTKVATTGENAGYIRRNAMNEAQIEVGWWPGNEAYPKPAYFSFTYPQPQGIETATVEPAAAHWDNTLKEFILDYDDLRKSPQPEKDLLAFFESTYAAGATLSKWPANFLTTGKPT